MNGLSDACKIYNLISQPARSVLMGVATTSTPSVPDPREIYLCAEAFRKATVWLKPIGQSTPEMWWSGEKTAIEQAAPALPYIVCEAMRVELYLKCLYVIDCNAKVKGHDVNQLFMSLKLVTRQTIEEKYKIEMATDGVQQFLGTFPADYRSHVVDLSKYLEVSRQNFESMRYVYERPADLMGGFPFLGNVLKETILLIRPEWA